MDFKLESPRLIIRPLTTVEVELLLVIHQKPEVNLYLPVRTDMDFKKLVEEAASHPDKPLNRWAIIEKSTHNFIGSCLMREFETGNPEVIEIGYSLDTYAWGKGYATEMAQLLKSYAFTLPKTKKLVAVTDPGNKASQAVLVKSGLKYKGLINRYNAPITMAYFEYNPETDFTIKEVTPEHVWPIRHRVMYPSHPFDSIKLKDDTSATHLGLYDEGELRAVVSLFANDEALQFRKFATEIQHQGKGYGKTLLKYIISYASQYGYKCIWCNARVSAAGFYEKLGFKQTNKRYTDKGIDFVIMEYWVTP